LREGQIAAAIKHPCVVEIYDIGLEGEIPFLVMELLEGQDLEALLRGGVPEERAIVDLLIPIVAGLVTVHDAGVVHRDLKPGNIFLSRRSNGELEPKLLDFGISKSVDRTQQWVTSVTQHALIGTPLYMSPEAMLGRPITPHSDQYSLGVLLYECTTGINPFVGGNFAETVRRVTSGDVVLPSARPVSPSPRLAEIIVRAMNVDPAQRFPDMRSLGRELMSLAGPRTQATWAREFGEHPGLARAQAATTGSAERKATSSRARVAALAAASVLTGVVVVTGLISVRKSLGRPEAAMAEAGVAASPAVTGLPPATERSGPAVTVLAPATERSGSPPSPAATSTASGDTASGDTAAIAAPPAQPMVVQPAGSDRPASKASRTEKSVATSRGSATRAGPRTKGSRRRQARTAGRPRELPSTSTAGAAAPDWLEKQPSPRRQPASTENGTNDAPILD
jgi:serine/threonine-protein kinase